MKTDVYLKGEKRNGKQIKLRTKTDKRANSEVVASSDLMSSMAMC